MSSRRIRIVESRALIYDTERAGGSRSYAGVVLVDASADLMGVAGWWFEPDRFLRAYVFPVLEEKLLSDTLIFGKAEDLNRLSIGVVGPHGVKVGELRVPRNLNDAVVEPMHGPFKDFEVRVASASVP